MTGYVRHGFIEALLQKKVIVLIYILQLVIALPIGMQVFQVIDASIGNSMSMDIIEEGFNRTVFEDFLNIHGASITPLIGTFRYIVATYLVLSIFLHAGIVGNIITRKNTISTFFHNAIKYFFAFLGINIAMMAISLLWTLVLWLPYVIIIGNPIEDHSSEKIFVMSLIAVAAIYITGIFLIWVWSLNVKYEKVKNEKSILTSLKNGWKLSRARGLHQFGLFLLFGVIHILTILLYFLISDPIGASSMILILFLMILQQLFALFRVGLRVSLYGSLLKSAETGPQY